MEILVLGVIALALVVTFSVIALKLVWLGAKLFFGLLALPFKILGGLVGALVGVVLLPIFVVLVVGAVFMGLALIPILIPILIVGLGIALLAHAC